MKLSRMNKLLREIVTTGASTFEVDASDSDEILERLKNWKIMAAVVRSVRSDEDAPGKATLKLLGSDLSQALDWHLRITSDVITSYAAMFADRLIPIAQVVVTKEANVLRKDKLLARRDSSTGQYKILGIAEITSYEWKVIGTYLARPWARGVNSDDYIEHSHTNALNVMAYGFTLAEPILGRLQDSLGKSDKIWMMMFHCHLEKENRDIPVLVPIRMMANEVGDRQPNSFDDYLVDYLDDKLEWQPLVRKVAAPKMGTAVQEVISTLKMLTPIDK